MVNKIILLIGVAMIILGSNAGYNLPGKKFEKNLKREKIEDPVMMEVGA